MRTPKGLSMFPFWKIVYDKYVVWTIRKDLLKEFLTLHRMHSLSITSFGINDFIFPSNDASL
jgi:hypothetical protein